MNQQLTFGEPRARRADAPTAHEAASVMKPGNEDCIARIRRWMFGHGPATAFQIADALVTEGRWQHDTIRSAVCRAGLVEVGTEPRHGTHGRHVIVYGLYVDSVKSELV